MDKGKLKVFINTVLGETFSESQNKIELGGLLKRKEEYIAPCPEGVLVLTAGADVQEDRIECEVVGWGKNQESWSIDYAVFMGDTERTFVWEQLDQYLMRMWTHQRGMDLNLAATAVDSGHRAKVVYNYCRLREHRRIFPIKGRYGWGQGYLKRPKKRNEFGVWLFLAMVDEIKSKIYSHLRISEPGAGYCHFPKREIYDKNYFKGLTSERLITTRSHGRATLQWELPQGYRNEPLDCRVYATMALNILNPNFELLGAKGPLIVQNKRARKGRVLSKGI
jgi:phage terminase large subunit GpA-like protein